MDHFSVVAPLYDRIFGSHDSARLAELLALPAGRLLDVGGGTGRVSGALAGRASTVVLADASQAMLGAARGKPGLARARARAERLPFATGSFDRVLVVDAFHHFSDHRRAARELLRVLAPGGRLVIEEMNYERLPSKVIALGEKLLLMRSRFYRPAALRRLFEAQGALVTLQTDDPLSMWLVAEKR